MTLNQSGRALLVVACGVLLAQTVRADQVLRSFDWQALASAGPLASGTVVPAPAGGGGPSLRVDHREMTRATFPLLTIEHPGITQSRFALRGRVKYDQVAAGSYLEMWTYLSGSAFFSRTLAPDGPVGRLEGSSAWRAFLVPFSNRPDAPPPDKLVFNLVLAGSGTVDIGPLELVEFAPGEDPLAGGTGWWSDRQSGLVGGIAGLALGILGVAIGWLGSTGRARALALGALRAIAWAGLAILTLGLLAVMRSQPYAVYYPLLLLGTISAALGFALRPVLKRRYEQLELRRMQALDG